MRGAMAIATRPGPFARKSHDVLVRDATADPEHGLKRSVGVLDLTALGIGAVIGTGIFVIIGEAIGDAGPSIIISFALAGVTCLFSAFSYAELASSIPVSGSAYTYGYATLGELVAWIIGWDLILEYGVAVAAVAVGWGGYLKSLLDSLFGINLPTSLSSPPGDGGTVNLPAVFLVLAVSALLISASARARGPTPSWSSRRSPSSSSSSSSAWARSTATTSRRGRHTASAGRSTRPR